MNSFSNIPHLPEQSMLMYYVLIAKQKIPLSQTDIVPDVSHSRSLQRPHIKGKYR